MTGPSEPWLPHGPEFRFVDQVLAHRPGRSVVGCLEAGAATPRLPYQGALPGFYVLESMIQTCGLLLGGPGCGEPAGRLAMVVALDRVRWFGQLRARERITTRCRVLRRSGPFLRCRCVARRADRRLIASAEVTLRAGAQLFLNGS